MRDAEGLPPIHIKGGGEVVEVCNGVLDALMAFGIALANNGVVERKDLADAMAIALDQLSRQPVNTRARRYPLEAMRWLFSRPVMPGGRGNAGLVPIDGGRKDE